MSSTALQLFWRKAPFLLIAIELIIHGTDPLATNALIERKGAKTALLVTDGFRDSIEIAYEHRFEQSDVFMERPPPLVPRDLRFDVPEKIGGRRIRPVTTRRSGAPAGSSRNCKRRRLRPFAIGFLHSYANTDHETRAGKIIQEAMPDAAVTLSSEVSPEIRGI